jgi:glycosyltransferase involved in cell wall biosynthesis
MIVKDESHIIHEALSCTLPLIDTYCIVDTGSTDNTIEKIKDFYNDKGISGEVHQSTWKDFGTNRSEALKLCDGKMDYILVIDADDLMSFPKNGKEIINNLIYQNKPNSLTITIRQGDLRYNRGQIFKADDGWKYVGVLHEFPSNSKSSNKTIKLPEEFFMNSRRLGGRNLKDGKMARDIEVLTKGLENEPDNERYMFYLAQSYRDNNNPEMAIKYYKQRFNIGRWHEEAWFSAYQVGECYYRMGNMLKFEYWMQKAFYFRPCRAEPIYKLYKHFKSSGHFFKAHQYYVIGYQIPFPTNDVLFIEKNVYGGFNDKTQYKINEENLTVEIKPNIKIYIVSCKIDRAHRLIKKAEVLNLNFEIIDSPFHTDEEVQLRGKECFENKTAYPGGFAATLGHLRAMKRFLETDDNHCMIVEDDVRFHKNFNDIMPYIKDYMERTDVNVFSLGFVNIPNINKKSSTLTLANRLVLENVPISNPWGCQCYMISRSHAKKLVEYFSVYNIYEVYKKFFVTDTVFYDNELGCKRSTLAIPIVAEDLSEETLAGNNNKPKLFDTGILDKNDFYF